MERDGVFTILSVLVWLLAGVGLSDRQRENT